MEREEVNNTDEIEAATEWHWLQALINDQLICKIFIL